MAKKDFTSKKTNTVDSLRTQVTSSTSDTTGVRGTKNTKEEEYRFSARFTPTQWAFLQELKWQSRRTITSILQDYVEADMKKKPDILKKIDELNG